MPASVTYHAKIKKRQKAYGFTLIELVIAIALITAVSGALVLNYSKFTERQKTKQQALTIKETLRLVQTKAKTGEKGASCTGITLYGWRVTFTATSLTYQPACPDAHPPSKTLTLKNGLSLNPVPAVLVFRPLNALVDGAPQSINVFDGTNTCTIDIDDNGEISDMGCTP